MPNYWENWWSYIPYGASYTPYEEYSTNGIAVYSGSECSASSSLKDFYLKCEVVLEEKKEKRDLSIE